MQPGRNSITEKIPWMTFGAIDFLKKIIRPDMQVFEYGSGGSTLFWTQRVRHVVSVEHDPRWYEAMRLQYQATPSQNLHYTLVEDRQDTLSEAKDPGDPRHYISTDPKYAGRSFQEYASAIDPYPDESFDIIVVDGRARPSCILHAIPKLKKQGYLVIDNTERAYYLSSFSFPATEWIKWHFPGPVPFSRGFSETTIFKRTS
jgi:hypothetical protein